MLLKVRGRGFKRRAIGWLDQAMPIVMREVMAKHIVNLAEHGERDESALTNGAFHFFTENYKA